MMTATTTPTSLESLALDFRVHAAPLPPMLRALGRDTGSTFVLRDFLVLNDVAPLNSTCRHWRRWLDTDGALGARHRYLTLSLLPLLVACNWLRRHLRSVELRGDPLPPPVPDACGVCYHRTHYLSTNVCGLLLPNCFDRLPHLTTLHLRIVDRESCDFLVRDMLQYAHRLPRLEALVFECNIDEPHLIPLSSLPQLPNLTRFELKTPCSPYEDFHCTIEQVRCLAQCTKLNWLHCGSWSPLSAEQQMERVGKFVQSRLRAAVTMEHLSVSSSVMTPRLWSHIAQLPSLKHVCPKEWRSGMSAKQWQQLAEFKQLQSIRISADASEVKNQCAPCVDDFLPPLLNCTQLTSIQLTNMTLHTEHLQQIAVRLTSLQTLLLTAVRLEHLAPLAAAPSLTSLSFTWCTNLTGGSGDFLRTLPALSHLTQLTLFDKPRYRLTSAEAEPLVAALLQRMPKLTTQGLSLFF